MTTYLKVENISKSYGTKVLFKNITFQISENQKIAFIAKNGTGKTSFIKILQGKDMPDEGKISFNKNIKVSFLDQEPTFTHANTILEEVLSRAGIYYQVIKTYEEAVAKNNVDEIQQAMAQMDLMKAWDFEARMRQILGKLKITDISKNMALLSGGEKNG